MTIRKGEPWGVPAPRPDDLRVAASDVAVVDAFRDDPGRPTGLAGGDLFRSLGSPRPRTDMQLLPVDLMDVTLDETRTLAVAHVIVRRSWWRGPVIVVTNVDHVGAWNVAPRAHPNDGRLDVLEVDAAMSIRRRLQARARLAAGTHVPHPEISVRTAATVDWAFSRPYRVWVDGVRVANARSVAVAVRPDAFSVLV